MYFKDNWSLVSTFYLPKLRQGSVTMPFWARWSTSLPRSAPRNVGGLFGAQNLDQMVAWDEELRGSCITTLARCWLTITCKTDNIAISLNCMCLVVISKWRWTSFSTIYLFFFTNFKLFCYCDHGGCCSCKVAKGLAWMCNHRLRSASVLLDRNTLTPLPTLSGGGGLQSICLSKSYQHHPIESISVDGSYHQPHSKKFEFCIQVTQPVPQHIWMSNTFKQYPDMTGQVGASFR